MNTTAAQQRGFVVGTLFIFFCAAVLHVSAQGVEQTTFASLVPIGGSPRDGDLVSYDLDTSTYRMSSKVGDQNLFGVIVDDPVLFMESTLDQEGVRPVVRFGEATVNVSTLTGEIQAGDLVTSSRIPGVGARAARENSMYILGFATEPMVYDEQVTPMRVDGEDVRFGKVSVALRIGPYLSDSVTDILMTSTTTGIGAGDVPETQQESGSKPVDPFKVFRYLLGTIVSITAVVLALRRFGDLFAQSVISVGRNPLARTQIRSILVWNAVLIIVVSSVGLGLGVAIIMLP